MRRGTKPEYEKDMEVKKLRDDGSLPKSKRTFRAIGERLEEDVKNIYQRYRRAGGNHVGRL